MVENTNLVDRSITRRGTGNPKEDFYYRLGWLVRCFLNHNGNMKPDEEVFAAFCATELTYIEQQAPEQYNLLKEVLVFIMNTDYIPEMIRNWLLEGGDGPAEFIRQNNINKNTFNSNRKRFREKVMFDFGDYALSDLSGNASNQRLRNLWLTEEELHNYRQKMALMQNASAYRAFKDSLSSDFKEHLEQRKGEFQKGMEPDQFNTYIGLLWLNSVTMRNLLMQECGYAGLHAYINYLYSTNSAERTPEEQMHYIMLERFTKGLDPFTGIPPTITLNTSVKPIIPQPLTLQELKPLAIPPAFTVQPEQTMQEKSEIQEFDIEEIMKDFVLDLSDFALDEPSDVTQENTYEQYRRSAQ